MLLYRHASVGMLLCNDRLRQRVVQDSSDPTVIRSIAVTTGDMVAALEMNRTTSKRAVLRVTPPFSGRMRARLHLLPDDGVTAADDTIHSAPADDTIHIDPAQLVERAPSYPQPAETEDELRAHSEKSYTVERHRAYHADVVAEWREQVADCIRDSVTLTTGAGRHEVSVKPLSDAL